VLGSRATAGPDLTFVLPGIEHFLPTHTYSWTSFTALYRLRLKNATALAALPNTLGPKAKKMSPRPNVQSTTYDNSRQARMMCATAENQVPECRATVEVCQNSKKNYSKKKSVLRTNMSLFFCLLRHGMLNLLELSCN